MTTSNNKKMKSFEMDEELHKAILQYQLKTQNLNQSDAIRKLIQIGLKHADCESQNESQNVQ